MKRTILLLVLLGFAVFAASSIRAQGTMDDITANAEAMSPEANLNLQQFVSENMEKTQTDIICSLTPERCIDPNTGEPVKKSGLIPTLGKNIAFVTTQPPAETGVYIADLLHNFGIAQPAYAQAGGFGFNALTPVLTMWKAFRNISYFLLTIVFIIIGFMIMFRAQINPQTVVTVQQALPKLILTLILITFSYAIASFVIDLIYLTLYLAIELFRVAGIISDPDMAKTTIFGRSVFGIGFKMIIGKSSVADEAASSVSDIISRALSVRWLNWLIDAIAYLIIAIAIVIAMFRTLFSLIITWVNIVLSIIFSPLQLLLNALPNQNTFGGWLKGLVANAAVFPATAIFLLIGSYLSGGVNEQNIFGLTPSEHITAGTGWVPPLVTERNASEWNGKIGATNTVIGIIGLGFIMLTPELGKIVKGLFGVEESQLGQMVGANLQRGAAPIQKIGGVPGTYLRTAGGFLMNTAAMGGAEKAVDTAQKVGLWSKAKAERYKQRIRNHPIATVDQVSRRSEDFSPEAPETPKKDT